MELNDYIIVGSGCCGSIVAKTLVEKGVKVTVLDSGILSEKKFNNKSEEFIEVRQKEEAQLDYLVGSEFESIGSIQKKNPVHLTPARMFTINQVEDYLTWEDGDFNPIESLAKGGLGNAWGLGAYVYSENELLETGLPVKEMQRAYQWLTSVIGISGGNDGSSGYSNGNLFTPQTAIPMDFNGQRLWNNVQKKNKSFHKNGFTIGRTPLAVSTDNSLNGEAFKGNDFDFYDIGKSSAFRPVYMMEQLEKTNQLQYIPHQLVLSFKEENGFTSVETFDYTTKSRKIYYCKKLILATGTLGTARIVMRATGVNKLPLICNTYSYIPSLQLPLIGAVNTGYQTGLAQLSLYYDPSGTHTRVAMGSLYSYRALMGFRLLREFPLGFKSGMQWLKLLQPALNVTGIFHPEYGSSTKYMERIADSSMVTGDKMRSCYQLSDEEEVTIKATENAFRKTLTQMSTIPVKVQRNKHGASIHYGGTLPFTEKAKDTPGINTDGRLHGYRNVFVADGSGFRFLSGKGLTLTLMAYAHVIAKKTLES